MESCIEWQGQRDKEGYGVRRGRAWAWTGTKRVHRQVWMTEHGFIPSDVFVLHSCDNPSCINLDHLRAGTHAENMADRRNKQGPRLTGVALTPQQKLSIRNYQRKRKQK